MINRWLHTLPNDLRRAPTCQIYALADEVIFNRLQMEPSSPLVRNAVDCLSDLASEHLENEADTAFVALLVREPRAIELGLVIAAAQMSLANEIPRQQKFYPAVLFDREILSVVLAAGDRDYPETGLLWAMIGLHDPGIVNDILACTARIDQGFAEGIRWPDIDVSKQLRYAIASIRDKWEIMARKMLFALRKNDGKLPLSIVEALIAPKKLPGGRTFVNGINRPRQKATPERLLVSAMQWPIRADRLLGNLELADGSLRLHIAYMHALWSSILRVAHEHDRNEMHLATHYAEVIQRDIAYVIAQGTDYPEKTVSLFHIAENYPQTRKKRLSRQRAKCLRDVLPIIDSDWVELLRDIASSYTNTEAH